MMTPDEYISDRIGKEYDYDGAFGAQCVDLMNHFCVTAGYPTVHCAPSGYAKDIWNSRHSNGVLKNFSEVTSISKLKKGDWIIWGDAPPNFPDSHVAMFVSRSGSSLQVLGQNQNGRMAANIGWFPSNGFLGALRPKCWGAANKVLELECIAGLVISAAKWV